MDWQGCRQEILWSGTWCFSGHLAFHHSIISLSHSEAFLKEYLSYLVIKVRSLDDTLYTLRCYFLPLKVFSFYNSLKTKPYLKTKMYLTGRAQFEDLPVWVASASVGEAYALMQGKDPFSSKNMWFVFRACCGFRCLSWPWENQPLL